MTQIIKTWKSLSDELGVSCVTLRNWRKEPDAPKSKSLSDWRRWRDEQMPTQGRDTSGEAQSLAELKRLLLVERKRKEAALASLHELELKTKAESLIPESEAQEVIRKTLIPLRRLIDSFPARVAPLLRCDNQQECELILRQAVDDFILEELQRVLSKQEGAD